MGKYEKIVKIKKPKSIPKSVGGHDPTIKTGCNKKHLPKGGKSNVKVYST